MAPRRRTLLLLCALGFGAVFGPASLAAAAPSQDPGVTFGGTGGETTTTTVAGASTTTGESQTNQTLVESEDTPDQPVFTENRKVAAVIAGLVIVALALLLLTVRYIRITKPRSSDDVDPSIPMLPPSLDLDLDDDSIFVEEPAEERVPPPAEPSAQPADTELPAPSTDHDAADDDWRPRTGEHQRVEVPTGATLVRPSLAARRRALGVDPD